MQTSPDGIRYPGLSDTTGIVPSLATLAEDVQDTFESRANYFRGDSTEMAAREATALEGAAFFNTDDSTQYRLTGGVWVAETVVVNDAYNYRVADATELGALTGMVAGDRAYQADTRRTWEYTGSIWVPNPLFCSLGKNSNQSIGTSETAITWEVDFSDPGDMHSTSSNQSRVTAPVTGLYTFDVAFYFSASAGFSTARARKNGSDFLPGSMARRDGLTSIGTPMVLQFSAVLAASDYVEIMLKHSTTTYQVNGNTGNELGPSLTCRYQGPA